MTDTGATTPSFQERFSSYVRTRKGTILAAEIVLSLVIFICYVASPHRGYVTVALCEMVFAAIFFGTYMTEFDKRFKIISWVWSDFVRAAIGAVLYLITSVICIINGNGALVAGGVFGLLATVLFAYDTYLSILNLKSKSQHSTSPTPQNEDLN